MKQPILGIAALLLFTGLTAFGYINRNHSNTGDRHHSAQPGQTASDAPVDFDFVYDVDTRFLSTITKEALEGAQTIVDILTPGQEEPNAPDHSFALTSFYDKPQKKGPIASYHNVEIHTFHGMRKGEIKVQGEDEKLNAGQIQLLRSMDYTTDFYITGNLQREALSGEGLVRDTLVQYLSVVPDQPAEYQAGKAELLTYLKKQSAATIAIARKNRIQPGKISFTITKDGGIGRVRLDYTSGYTAIDEKMLELIRDLPGAWKPAANAAGEKVEQELIFFFGVKGC